MGCVSVCAGVRLGLCMEMAATLHRLGRMENRVVSHMEMRKERYMENHKVKEVEVSLRRHRESHCDGSRLEKT